MHILHHIIALLKYVQYHSNDGDGGWLEEFLQELVLTLYHTFMNYLYVLSIQLCMYIYIYSIYNLYLDGISNR